jgi:virulence-associated protein VapD
MTTNKQDFKELFENKFLYNDSVSATASKFLLAFLAAGPLLVVGAALPGVISAVNSIRQSKKYSKPKFQNAYRNLHHRKLIEIIQEKNGKVRVQLTNKGQKRIKDFYFENMQIAKPKKWDGKWRVLIFDIPTKPPIYNQARNALRNKIKDLGFYQMQKSVWICPYECEDQILFVAEIFQVQKHIEILTVEKLLHEEKIRRIFKL